MKNLTRRVLWPLVLGFVAYGAAFTLQAADSAPSPLTIVLDSGHNPGQPGALGVRGVYEMVYNDALTAKIAAALRASGFSVILTRAPGQTISLEDRAQTANTSHADLFLAIHHDSAQPKYLSKIMVNQTVAYKSNIPLSGYSLFVSQRNPRYADSYQFAECLGENLQKLGRAPAQHHAENIPGENREWLNKSLGIYRFDDLIVLKKTQIPAVLLEVGVIVDADDEKYVSNPDNQAAIINAIVAAIEQFKRARAKL